MKKEGQKEGGKERRMLSRQGQPWLAALGGWLSHGLGSHIPSKGVPPPWGAVEGTWVTGGRPMAWCCSGLGWGRGGCHVPSSPISLSWLGRPHGCNLGVVNTSGEFLNLKNNCFHLN